MHSPCATPGPSKDVHIQQAGVTRVPPCTASRNPLVRSSSKRSGLGVECQVQYERESPFPGLFHHQQHLGRLRLLHFDEALLIRRLRYPIHSLGPRAFWFCLFWSQPFPASLPSSPSPRRLPRLSSTVRKAAVQTLRTPYSTSSISKVVLLCPNRFSTRHPCHLYNDISDM